MVRKSASGRTLLENTYDLNGNRVGLKDYSGKETVYTYDALDRISKVTDNGHELIDYLYNDDGTLKRWLQVATLLPNIRMIMTEISLVRKHILTT